MMRVEKTLKRGMPKILVLCITAYTFLFLITPLHMNNRQESFPEKLPEMIEVATMKSSLPAMTVITSDYINKEMVSRDELPEGRLVSPAQIICRILAVPVVEGQVLTESCFTSKGNVEPVLHGMRAFTVPVSGNDITDKALLYPGCVVDILVSYKLSSSGHEELTTTMLRGIQVLAVSADMVLSQTRDNGEPKKRSAGKATRVTLLVTPKQIEALQLAADNGTLSLSISSPLDRND